MIAAFDWCDCHAITEPEKRDVEATIRRDVEGRFDAKFKPCHPGQLTVQLNVVGPLLSDLVGNIKCSCSRPYFKINGTSDASRVTYERVE